MKCFNCSGELKKDSRYVSVEECYGGGQYGTSMEKEEGEVCRSCGVFLGETVVAYKNKTYPYWKYGVDDLKNIFNKV